MLRNMNLAPRVGFIVFTDAIKAKGAEETLIARDIAELVAESMELK